MPSRVVWYLILISKLWETFNRHVGILSRSLRGCWEPASQAYGLAWILQPGMTPSLWTGGTVHRGDGRQPNGDERHNDEMTDGGWLHDCESNQL